MKKICFVLFILGLSFTLNCRAGNETKSSLVRLDKIVAVVNRDIITQSQLTKEMDRLTKQLEHTNQAIPPQAELRKQAMDLLIAKNLQMQICQAKGLKVPKEDVEAAITSIAKNNKITVNQLKDAIEQGGMAYDEYKAQIAEQLLFQKLQQDEVAKTVSLSPEDVKQFVAQNKNKFNAYNAFHLVDVVLPTNAPQAAPLKKQASDIVSQLQTGKDIDAIVKQYPGLEKNDLGWRSLAEIPSLFQSKVAGMRINSVTAPIQAPNGLHILKLVEARGENIKPTETQLKNLAFQQKMVEAVKVWVDKLKSDAYIKIMN